MQAKAELMHAWAFMCVRMPGCMCKGTHAQESKCKGMGAQVHLNVNWDICFKNKKRDRLTLTFINIDRKGV